MVGTGHHARWGDRCCRGSFQTLRTMPQLSNSLVKFFGVTAKDRNGTGLLRRGNGQAWAVESEGGWESSGSRGWRENESKGTRKHNQEQGGRRLNRLGAGSGFPRQVGAGGESSGLSEVSRASKKEQQQVVSCGSLTSRQQRSSSKLPSWHHYGLLTKHRQGKCEGKNRAASLPTLQGHCFR